ncbi:hypothetical protein LX36DRAFT_325689 [Colletotrichum falcatum]|nr:hypothetical protein LX36DRAFT_325689 [Colletotrichum falcatum]
MSFVRVLNASSLSSLLSLSLAISLTQETSFLTKETLPSFFTQETFPNFSTANLVMGVLFSLMGMESGGGWGCKRKRSVGITRDPAGCGRSKTVVQLLLTMMKRKRSIVVCS